jgi:hypothetical protein
MCRFRGFPWRVQRRKPDARERRRKFKKTVMARIERDPVFAKALLDEAANLFLSGELKTARVILRDLLNTTLGFEQLARFRTRARPRG